MKMSTRIKIYSENSQPHSPHSGIKFSSYLPYFPLQSNFFQINSTFREILEDAYFMHLLTAVNYSAYI